MNLPDQMARTAPIRFRPFDGSEADYQTSVEISNANYPEHAQTAKDIRHEDQSRDTSKYELLRLMAEDAPGRTSGYGQIDHMPHQYHPQKFWLDIGVFPDAQGRGYGSAIYERMLAELRQRSALSVRTVTKENMAKEVAFLTHRGFVEVQRSWESRLDVTSFDFISFSKAGPRVLGQGIVFTTLAQEMAVNRETALQAAHALHERLNADVPAVNPYTPRSFEIGNQAMLRINEAMGFARQPAWVIFEKTLTPHKAGEGAPNAAGRYKRDAAL